MKRLAIGQRFQEKSTGRIANIIAYAPDDDGEPAYWVTVDDQKSGTKATLVFGYDCEPIFPLLPQISHNVEIISHQPTISY